jgi:hypothetical protein
VRIDVDLDAKSRCKRRCSCCRRPGRIHDKLPRRQWYFVPLWNIRPGWESDPRMSRERHLSLVASATDPARIPPRG